MDKEGKTPLIVACMNPELYNVAKTLIELGANINAYRPGIDLFLVCYGFLFK
jgi:ankyrin repeat protein